MCAPFGRLQAGDRVRGVMSLVERAVVFRSGEDECLGILHPAQAPAAKVGILIIVGGPQYRVGSHRQFVHLARYCAAAGYPVLRFDYRGMGDSCGRARDFVNIESDIRSAIDAFVAAAGGLRSVVLFGLCDAASAAMMYCGSDPRVDGLILANPWVRTEAGLARAHVTHYYRNRLRHGSFWKKLTSGRIEILPAIRGFLRSLSLAVSRAPGDTDAESPMNFLASMQRGFADFRRPALVLISGRDLTAKEFTDLCSADIRWRDLLVRPNVAVETLRDADHTFSDSSATDQVNLLCSRWLDRNLGSDAR